jgi:Predicted esterase of the alpha/beta hydrolase fold
VPPRILILPGLYDSGPEHWQSYWERSGPFFSRVEQSDWETPAREDWVAKVELAVEQFGPDVVLVAHSSACALVAFWAAQTTRSVRGALLVAPSDTEASSYPIGPTGWRPMPLMHLRFPTIVVASTNDEFVTIDRAKMFADAWGSRFVNIGKAGHINSTSALGDWDTGRKLLADLIQQTESAT